MIDFVSDRELGKRRLESEEITLNIYNGIISLIDKFKLGLAEEYPIYCDDYDGVIYGCNRRALNTMIIAFIPELEDKLYFIDDKKELPSMYCVLDLVEFIYSKLVKYNKEEHHSFMKHYHLSFDESDNSLKEEFRSELNQLFERNGVVFYLDDRGLIKRQLPLGLEELISKSIINTNDDKLNQLVQQSIENISKPKKEDRVYAIEKLWDAFERMKTFYSSKKRDSADKLVDEVSKKTKSFNEVIREEFRTLSSIGNEYQIRHFETDKIEICDLYHFDYLYYRMMAVISLCCRNLNLF